MTRNKKTEKNVSVVTAEADESGVEESRSVKKTVGLQLPRILSELSEDEREVLLLWSDGDTLSTIAGKTGMSIGATARTLKKVQKKLVDELFNEIDEIVEEIQCDRAETDKLKEETRFNISELQRMMAA